MSRLHKVGTISVLLELTQVASEMLRERLAWRDGQTDTRSKYKRRYVHVWLVYQTQLWGWQNNYNADCNLEEFVKFGRNFAWSAKKFARDTMKFGCASMTHSWHQQGLYAKVR